MCIVEIHQVRCSVYSVFICSVIGEELKTICIVEQTFDDTELSGTILFAAPKLTMEICSKKMLVVFGDALM